MHLGVLSWCEPLLHPVLTSWIEESPPPKTVCPCTVNTDILPSPSIRATRWKSFSVCPSLAPQSEKRGKRVMRVYPHPSTLPLGYRHSSSQPQARALLLWHQVRGKRRQVPVRLKKSDIFFLIFKLIKNFQPGVFKQDSDLKT